jgi:hypothetical protein
MEGWISKQANQIALKPLSSAGYGGKRTAVFHLFRVHNGKGPMQDFQDEMTALWKEFSRTTNKKISWMMTLKKVAVILVTRRRMTIGMNSKKARIPCLLGCSHL